MKEAKITLCEPIHSSAHDFMSFVCWFDKEKFFGGDGLPRGGISKGDLLLCCEALCFFVLCCVVLSCLVFCFLVLRCVELFCFDLFCCLVFSGLVLSFHIGAERIWKFQLYRLGLRLIANNTTNNFSFLVHY